MFIICLRPPIPFPLHTIYEYIGSSVLIHTGKGGRWGAGGGQVNQHEWPRGASSQEGSKIPTWLTVSISCLQTLLNTSKDDMEDLVSLFIDTWVHEVHLYFFALSWGSTRVLWTVRGKQCVSGGCPASTADSQSWCTAASPSQLFASAHSSSSSAMPWTRRQGEDDGFVNRIKLKFLFLMLLIFSLFVVLLCNWLFPSFFGLKSIYLLCGLPWLSKAFYTEHEMIISEKKCSLGLWAINKRRSWDLYYCTW